MRTIDIINLLSSFDRVFEDSVLTNEEKIAVGEEVLNQLPLPHLIASRQASIVAVERSIRSRLDELEKLIGNSKAQDRGSEGAEQSVGTNERQGTAKPKQPLRKAKSNA